MCNSPLEAAIGKLKERDGMTKAQRRLLELNFARLFGEMVLPDDIFLDALAEMAEELQDEVQREIEISRLGRAVIDRELIAIAAARFFAPNTQNSRDIAAARSRAEVLLDLPPKYISKLERKHRRKSRATGLETEPISRGVIEPEAQIVRHTSAIKSAESYGADVEIFIVEYYIG